MPSQQAPLPSGFDQHTTARQALAGRDLRGAIAVVTGGHAGLGLETTRALADAGATVVVAARSLDAARAVIDTARSLDAAHEGDATRALDAAHGGGLPRVEADTLDLMDPASIDAFAARFLASRRPLHMLINNAGIMATPLSRDARGFESQLATNHLGHFQLTARLWPALRAARGARVVSLSSRGHSRAGVDFEDPSFERRAYDKWIAYGQSKSANALFALALDARGEAHRVRAFSVHPGAVLTELSRSIPAEEMDAIRARLAGTHFKTTAQGAATSVWCAVSPQLDGKGGVYCEDVDVAVPVAADATSLTGVRPWAIDPDAAERLWTLTETWTGVPFRP